MNAVTYPKGTVKALSRSLRIYHGDKERHAAMDRLYGAFLSPGDLAFDIGAHVGDRISSFRRLGARVVALEPQPGPAQSPWPVPVLTQVPQAPPAQHWRCPRPQPRTRPAARAPPASRRVRRAGR